MILRGVRFLGCNLFISLGMVKTFSQHNSGLQRSTVRKVHQKVGPCFRTIQDWDERYFFTIFVYL